MMRGIVKVGRREGETAGREVGLLFVECGGDRNENASEERREKRRRGVEKRE